jgi:hypothetical protein
MALVTRAVIKSDWLNIAAIDTSRDALIDRLIGYVDNEIKDICQQPIEQESVTVFYEGSRDTLLFTGYTVPVTLTSLASRDSYADNFVAVTSTTNLVDIRGNKYIFLQDGFVDREYQAVMSVGYTTVPTIIALCAAELVTELYLSTPFAPQTNRFGVTAITESEAGVSISKTLRTMRDRVKPRLAPYTRVAI